ncbi:MAG: hypothetical protein ABEK36_04385 [Candidatus Aenigmatarchaeota archaeon]
MTQLIYPKHVTLAISGTDTGESSSLQLQAQRVEITGGGKTLDKEDLLGGGQCEKASFPEVVEVSCDILSDDDTFEEVVYGSATHSIEDGTGELFGIVGSVKSYGPTSDEVKGNLQIRYADDTGSIKKVVSLKNVHMSNITYTANVDDGGGKGTFTARCTALDSTGSPNIQTLVGSGGEYIGV